MKRKTMIDGILFAVQYLIIIRDQPTFAEEIMMESGYSEENFLEVQKKTKYHSNKINPVIRNAFKS